MALESFPEDLSQQLLHAFARYRRHVDNLAVQSKPDHTLLTEADLAIQQLILEALNELEPDLRVVAEESALTAHRASEWTGRVWVVDPIDGTAEFVKQEGREFAAVVCLLVDGLPEAALIVAPELGRGRSPVVLTCDAGLRDVRMNGAPALGVRHPRGTRPLLASATRSSNQPPRPFEARLPADWSLKTRTTSQTLDMVRTCVDIESATGLPPFAWFFRERQKLWDGVAGMAVARATQRAVTDREGETPLPLAVELLDAEEPLFTSTLISDPAMTENLVGLLHRD